MNDLIGLGMCFLGAHTLFDGIVHFATGMWRLTVPTGSPTPTELRFETLVSSVRLSAAHVTAIGNTFGAFGYHLPRFLLRRRGPTGQ